MPDWFLSLSYRYFIDPNYLAGAIAGIIAGQ
jgi:hypothetical protein